MIAMTSADHIESLAIRIFRRDHPERLWRRDAGQRELGEGHEATTEERALYREFAMGRISEENARS